MGRHEPILPGTRFERWTVLKYMGQNQNHKESYLARCDCGVERVVVGANLKNGSTHSCGCYKSEQSQKLLPVGFRYGCWVVTESDAGRDAISRVLCRVRCDCGNETVMPSTHLRRGGSRSCGCLTREISRKNSVKVHTTHGMTKTPEHRVWSGMKNRCTNQKSSDYSYYGGRGIKVCDEWMHSFEAFFRDMGPKPGPEYSLDRIDVDGPYSPENCRWTTNVIQANNTRSNIVVQRDGRTQAFSLWCRELGLNYDGTYYWITQGYSPEDAIDRQIEREASGWVPPSQRTSEEAA